MSDSFYQTVSQILSVNDYEMKAAAGAWMALAGVATRTGDDLGRVAGETSAEPGVGLAELADSLGATGGWGGQASSLAMAISRQLQDAGGAAAEAAERAESLRIEYEKNQDAKNSKDEDAATASGSLQVQADKGSTMHVQRMNELAREAIQELSALDHVIGGVTGGDAPTAPEVSPAPGGGFRGAGALSAGGGELGLGAGGHGPVVVAPNGATVGAGSYPYSSIVGPDGGDFAGWVQSPGTGFLVDPATGREFDPSSGRWIDPVTGRPFGEVTQYATRLSGLDGGVTGAGGGVVAGGAALGAAGVAGLYGGVAPPSVAGGGRAQAQISRQAGQNLAHKAELANRLGAREARQGGRPFTPPPGASSQRSAGGAARAARQPSRTVTDKPAGRRSSAADAAARHRLGGGQPSAGATRGAPGAARGAPGPAPGAAGGQKARGVERKRREGKGTEMREDAEVWRPQRRAVPGTLGE
ncbi:hypothetical protein [Streptomyces sulphureus]|uniref:hypothetical protein n=1 Tax=Streptomyces sulphureus TaxID=47758 RepID=UPI0003A2C508|nr:hypothetical protein [Streptomyces sulphureus]